jgi:signal peptidase I
MIRPRPLFAAVTGLAGAVLVVGLVTLWPMQLGGRAAYLTTHGVSMNPRFHTGDLAVLRAGDHYGVGDIVAYHSTTLHTPVMHRIVAVQDGHYTFKGDNNSWTDPDRPTSSQLIGKLTVRVPHGGRWLTLATKAVPLALVALALMAGGIRGATLRRGRRRRRIMSRHAKTRSHGMSRHLKSLPPPLATAAVLTAVTATAGVLLLLRAASVNATASSATASHPRKVVFSYTSPVRPSAAYDGPQAASPDPIFRKITDAVDVGIQYSGPRGRFEVTAELSTSSGWHSSLQLVPATTFTANHYATSVRLQLPTLDARAQAAAAATGLPAGPVTVAIQPTITTADKPVFRPALRLTLTPLQLTLAGGPASLLATESPSAAGRLHTDTLAGRKLLPATERALSLGLLILSGLAGAITLLLARLGRGASEGAAIRRRYSALLVEVDPITTSAGRPVIDVTEFPTLARLAERYGLLILHWSRSGTETFLVQDENNTYRYRAAGSSRVLTGV